MEYTESFEETARRETMEEAGIELADIRFLHTTNDIFLDEKKHYVTIFMEAKALGEPVVCEPDKTDCWTWFSWDAMPEPLFLPIRNLQKDGVRPSYIYAK